MSSSSTIEVKVGPSGVCSTVPCTRARHASSSIRSRAANASNVVSMQSPSDDSSMCSGDQASTSPSSSGDGPPWSAGLGGASIRAREANVRHNDAL